MRKLAALVFLVVLAYGDYGQAAYSYVGGCSTSKCYEGSGWVSCLDDLYSDLEESAADECTYEHNGSLGGNFTDWEEYYYYISPGYYRVKFCGSIRCYY